MLAAYDECKKSFGVLEVTEGYRKAKHILKTTAITYFTGTSVQLLQTTSNRADKRSRLQADLARLSDYGANEEQLDAVLRTQVDKAMRA